MAILLRVPEPDEDVVSGVLWELGTLGVEVRAGASGICVLLAYFPAGLVTPEVLRDALAASPGTSFEPTPVPDVDWVARFRENFRAFDAGTFRIAPVWDLPAGLPAGRRVIVVDPGRAFGTGTHETTRLCLRGLERIFAERAVDALLDGGTGTGILAIAATLLGARHVVATENDPDAVANAREHLALNNSHVDLRLGDGARELPARSFDVVVANITAPLLTERAGEILAVAAPGADVLLSGLLATELDSVREAYAAAGASTAEVDGEWACLRIRTR